MDPELFESLYNEGYNARARRSTSGVLSGLASSVISTLSAPTSSSAALGRREMVETGETTALRMAMDWLIDSILAGLSWILDAVLTTLRIFFFAFVGAAVLVGLRYIPHLIRWLDRQGLRWRERYDDAALRNEYLLHCEQTWAMFTRWCERMYYAARYNHFTDKLRLMRQWVRIWVPWALWWMTVASVPLYLLSMSISIKLKSENAGGQFTAWRDLRGRFGVDLPEWLTVPKKWEGSNSHYQREADSAEMPIWLNGLPSTRIGEDVSAENLNRISVSTTERKCPGQVNSDNVLIS